MWNLHSCMILYVCHRTIPNVIFIVASSQASGIRGHHNKKRSEILGGVQQILIKSQSLWLQGNANQPYVRML